MRDATQEDIEQITKRAWAVIDDSIGFVGANTPHDPHNKSHLAQLIQETIAVLDIAEGKPLPDLKGDAAKTLKDKIRHVAAGYVNPANRGATDRMFAEDIVRAVAKLEGLVHFVVPKGPADHAQAQQPGWGPAFKR